MFLPERYEHVWGEQLKAGLAKRSPDLGPLQISAVGAPPAIELGLQVAGICASVNLFAGTYPPATIPLDPNLVHYKQLSLVGSHDFTPHDFTNALTLLATGRVRVEPLISHEFPLERLREAFEMVTARRPFGVVDAWRIQC